MYPDVMHARRAIESLRSGVPNRDVVAQLGTTQNQIRDRFNDALEAIDRGSGVEPILISATFGAGKTHLLNYLRSLAESDGFVTSYVVISPEAPLGDAQIICKVLAEAAHAPGRTGRALRTLAPELSKDPNTIIAVKEWIERTGVDDRFRALLHLYDAFRPDDEFRMRALSDFEGHGLLKTELKRRLKQIDESPSYDLNGLPSRLLAPDRIRLLAQLFKACGCKGWVILFDEMERLAKFPLKQRLAAYAQLGWWRRIAQSSGSAILPVFTTASGFVAETVVGGTRDEGRLITSGLRDQSDIDACEGVEFLKSPLRISSPTLEQEAKIKQRVRSIYERAYGVSVLPPADDVDIRISIRTEIRRWITRWDLSRYYPEYRADVAVDEISFDTEEIDECRIAFDDEEQD